MDKVAFDDLARDVAYGASRRGLLRAGLRTATAALVGALGMLGFDEADASNHTHRRHRHRQRRHAKQDRRKKRRAQRCTAARPITCGSGCCGSFAPNCCDDFTDVSGKSCVSVDQHCCPADLGGGSCRTEATCCPAFKGGPKARCAFPGAHCCPPKSGGSCEDDRDCCPPTTTNDDNGGCCSSGSACCNTDDDCESGSCQFGCCPV